MKAVYTLVKKLWTFLANSRAVWALFVAFLWVFVLGFLAHMSMVHAATGIPSTADPSVIDKAFEIRAFPETVPENVLPKVDEPVKITAPEAHEVTFTFVGLEVSGTVYPKWDTLHIYERLKDTGVSMATLYQIKQAITVKYRNDGYILAQAYISPQDIIDGRVKYHVDEGRISHVSFNGDMPKDNDLIYKIANRLTKIQPINVKDIERALLLINDLGGITAKSVLKPTDEKSVAELAITIEKDKTEYSTAVDNWGSRYLGPWQVTGEARINNLTGEYDTLGARYIRAGMASELDLWEFSHTLPLNKFGTKFTARASKTKTQPGYDLTGLEVQGDTINFEAYLTHPLIRTRAHSLSVRAGLDYLDSKIDNFGGRVSADKLRVARAGANYEMVDKFKGINVVDAEYSYGLDLNNASRAGDTKLSRTRGVGSSFHKGKVDVARLQSLAPHLNLLIALSGQFSSHALLASEEFTFGGSAFGKGYDPAEITGDHGIASKVELHYNFTTDLLDWMKLDVGAFQVFTFYDVGAVFNKDREALDPKKKTAASAGFGLRAQLGDSVQGSIEFAKPLTREVASQGEREKKPSIFFRLKGEF